MRLSYITTRRHTHARERQTSASRPRTRVHGDMNRNIQSTAGSTCNGRNRWWVHQCTLLRCRGTRGPRCGSTILCSVGPRGCVEHRAQHLRRRKRPGDAISGITRLAQLGGGSDSSQQCAPRSTTQDDRASCGARSPARLGGRMRFERRLGDADSQRDAGAQLLAALWQQVALMGRHSQACARACSLGRVPSLWATRAKHV